MSVTKDDNASDKTLNNDLLTNISTHMARHGLSPGAYFYVADAAFVTKVLSYEYLLSATIVEAPEKVAPLGSRQEIITQDCAEFWFVYKAHPPAHIGICVGGCNAVDGPKNNQDV